MTSPTACRALLTEALALAQSKAAKKPPLVRDILATGTAEAPDRGSKHAVVRYRAEKYRRTWLTLIEWRYFENFNVDECAQSMVETVEGNVHLTETDSWPKPPARKARRKKHG